MLILLILKLLLQWRIMRINIAYNNSLRTFDSPSGVYFVGVGVIYNGNRFEVLNSYTDSPYKEDEEIVLDANLKIILHYYSDAILAEILKEFSGYEGLSFIEIKNEVFHISVCI